ncbi:MAG: A24 family peptidase [Phycisphaerae bacterium]
MLIAVVVTLWWVGFWTAVGLCLGSFLNVVIYRLPRSRSLRAPLWSACPYCEHQIRWYDNLPIISFIALRGRCRDCKGAIPTHYLVVEVGTALIVLLLLDAFFIGHSRAGLSSGAFGLTDQLALDWPVFTAHIVLLACLFSMSAIDLKHYWVDVRFTNVAAIAGFVLHALWTPSHSASWIRPFDTTAVVSFCALVGLALVWIVLTCQPRVDPEDFGESYFAAEEVDASDPSTDDPPWPPLEPPSRVPGWIGLGLLVILFVWLVAAGVGEAPLGHLVRALVPLVFFFCLIVRESSIPRESDREIIEAIEGERSQARRMVLGELVLLLPAAVLACVGFYLVNNGADLAGRVHEALQASARIPGLAMMRSWAPLYGLATAATGYVFAGALGWLIRIVFTLLFGKEAFGSGDVHLMAAAGAVTGWPVVALAFMLTCALASLGWLMLLPFKRARAIPLGPWLSLSILTVVLFYDTMLQWPFLSHAIDAAHMLFLHDSQA